VPSIAADSRSGRRIAWWIGGAALISAALALTMLLPEREPASQAPPPGAGLAPGQAPVGETPVAEAPMGEAPAETFPEQDLPEQELPAQELPVEETPVEGAPGEEIGVTEAPLAEAPSAEEPVAAVPSPVLEQPPPRREPARAAAGLGARTVPLVAGETVWAVHVSSFQTQASADEQAARFESAGLPTLFHAVEVPDKGRWIRIYVGPFADRATAEEAAGRIRAEIQEYTMVRRLPAGELQDGTGREDR
jgi:cell division septation protein DedD